LSSGLHLPVRTADALLQIDTDPEPGMELQINFNVIGIPS
jgi:hypothetical protein